jgi:mRNA interferase RelE/StbE
VVDHDLRKIPVETRKRIAAIIVERLATNPERFGAPLKGSLRGSWKLRAGDYRIVFKVGGSDVWILAVVHRKDVYERASRRVR